MKEKKPPSLPQLAGMLCNDKEFIVFITAQNKFNGNINNYESTTEWAADYIRGACGVPSRSDLNIDPAAAMKFKKIVDEFHAWKLERQYPDNLAKIR